MAWSASSCSLHPAQRDAGEARPQVALLGLAPGRRLAGAVHDLQRHLDDVPVPRRVPRPPATCPTASGAFVSNALGRRPRPARRDASSLEGIGLLLHIGVMLVFLVDVLHSKHLHIFIAPLNVMFSRRPVGARRGQADDERRQAGHPRRRRGPRRGRHARRRLDRGLHLEGHARLRDLHRVRSLPVAVPGLEHREAAVAQDADHEPARPRVRATAPYNLAARTSATAARCGVERRGAERPLVGETEGVAWEPTAAASSTPTCCGRA